MDTVTRWIVRLLLGALALLLLAYVAYGLWGTGQVHEARDEAREVVGALERDRGAVEESIGATRDAFGEPARSYSQVVCELTSLDAGWMVTDYAQRCALEAVDVHRATPRLRARVDAYAYDEERDAGLEVTDCADSGCVPAPLSGEGVDGETGGRGARAGTAPRVGVDGDLAPGAYVVVRARGPEEQVELGCHPWKPVFCSAPTDRPVVG